MITVKRESDDRLTQWEWRFYYERHALWLDRYAEFQRPTRRHGFSRTQVYGCIDVRNDTLIEADVVLPADVKNEAIKMFCEGITVKRCSERK